MFKQQGLVLLTFLMFSIHSLPSFAAIQSFTMTNYGTVKINVPDHWESLKDIYGIPLSLVGPLEGSRRPVITVSPTMWQGVKLSPEVLKKDESGYKFWRENWLKGAEGQSIQYFPYQYQKFSAEVSAHSIGYRYKVDQYVFEERSHYIECNNRVYHLKSVLNSKNESKYSSAVDGIVRSFKCE